MCPEMSTEIVRFIIGASEFNLACISLNLDQYMGRILIILSFSLLCLNVLCHLLMT